MINKKIALLFFALSASLTSVIAQNDTWQEYMQHLTYSPRYFGPNAFPIPELQSGRIGTSWEVEVRGEYHIYSGDRTKDIFARIFIPVVKERVGVEVSRIFYEYYNMTQETVEERHAAGRFWKEGTHGDVVISTFFKLLKSDKWADIMFESTLKTTTGKRLSDARYTDAASYWFSLNVGRNLLKSADSKSFIRLQGLMGFYCWMTNSIVNRQDDAPLYAAGISGVSKNLSVHADLAGFYGYLNNGDRPLVLRTKLNYEYRKNIFSFRYKHGIKDYLYDTYSIGFIRCF